MTEAGLPDGWTQGSVRSLYDCWGGMTPSTSVDAYWGGDIPWVSSKDVKSWSLVRTAECVTKQALAETRLRECRPGTVLVVVRSGVLAHTLPVSLVTLPVVINQDVKALDSGNDDMNRWLALYLRAHAQEILRANRKEGTTVQSIRVEELLGRNVPVPPIAEQRRILEKVESLLAEVNRVKGRLERVRAILKRFRESVLAAACSGKLTGAWRDEQGIGDARALLMRAREFVETQTLVRRKGVPMPEVGTPDAKPPSVPNSWFIAALREVAVVLSGQTPKGIDALVGTKGQVPWLKVGDMNAEGNERRMVSVESWLTERQVQELGLRPIPAGAVVFPKRGGAIATNKKRILVRDSCVDLNTMAFVPFEPLGPYLWWWFSSIDLGSISDGSTVPQVNHPDIERLLVPVPPLEEQAEIVRRLEEFWELGQLLEQRLSQAFRMIERVSSSVLSLAFKGQLTTPEADLARAEGRSYESATALLERIRREGGTEEGPKQARGRQTTRKRRP